MLVGQFYVAQLGVDSVKFTNMCATLRRSDNSLSQAAFNISVIPAPGALALLGVAGFASRRRRA
jgi:hypothetical protein